MYILGGFCLVILLLAGLMTSAVSLPKSWAAFVASLLGVYLSVWCSGALLPLALPYLPPAHAAAYTLPVIIAVLAVTAVAAIYLLLHSWAGKTEEAVFNEILRRALCFVFGACTAAVYCGLLALLICLTPVKDMAHVISASDFERLAELVLLPQSQTVEFFSKRPADENAAKAEYLRRIIQNNSLELAALEVEAGKTPDHPDGPDTPEFKRLAEYLEKVLPAPEESENPENGKSEKRQPQSKTDERQKQPRPAAGKTREPLDGGNRNLPGINRLNQRLRERQDRDNRTLAEP